jgi:uncharacterized protein (DUF488 family)
MAHPFFTIGHGKRSIDEFTALLKEAAVTLVVDVRTVPRSRSNPQFNTDTLPASLEANQIAYEHIAALGGLRGKQRTVPSETNAFWDNASFHNYADHAMGDAFHTALARLRQLSHGRCCTIMCAETVWWRCHRRIIADYLIASGERVFHIVGPGRIEAARPTPGARIGPGPTVTYPQQPDDSRLNAR